MDQMYRTLEASERMSDFTTANNDLERDLVETDKSVQLLVECAKIPAGSTGSLPEVNTDSKLPGRQTNIEAVENMDRVLIMDENHMDTWRISEGNVVQTRKGIGEYADKEAKGRCGIQSMDHTSGMSKLHLIDGQETVGEFIIDEVTAQDSKLSIRKESSLSDFSDAVSLGLGEVLSSDRKEDECSSTDLGQYPRIATIAATKRKLLVLDVNGLLADILMPAPKDRKADSHILRRAIFKRPFCDDFLKFCFDNFEVAIWSSRSNKVILRVVDFLLGDLKNKLLFCWDMTHSTQTGFKTLENIHKPLVFKELKKIWENDDPNPPWKIGDYDESNTLLLDDSPYKALLNPKHTAIFPNSYHYQDTEDNSLGPGGDLRVYVEGLLASENVQDYVEQHPYGQHAINETSSTWEFYSGVLQAMSNQVEENSPSPVPNSSSQQGF